MLDFDTNFILMKVSVKRRYSKDSRFSFGNIASSRQMPLEKNFTRKLIIKTILYYQYISVFWQKILKIWASDEKFWIENYKKNFLERKFSMMSTMVVVSMASRFGLYNQGLSNILLSTLKTSKPQHENFSSFCRFGQCCYNSGIGRYLFAAIHSWNIFTRFNSHPTQGT